MAALRIVFGVIGGYVPMAALITVWAFLAVPMIYPELAPVNGEYPKAPLDHSGFILELPVNFVAGLIGGLACGLIAGRNRKVSAAIMCGLMLAMSIPALWYTDIKPLWATIAAPLLGIAAIAAVTALLQRRDTRAG